MLFFLRNNKRFQKKQLQICFAFLLLLIKCISLNAQQANQIPLKRCPVKTINFEQGLMNIGITSAITDSKGFTWFSTKTGLQRYNGYVLETITPVADGDSIPINYAVFFLNGKNNSILIGYKKGVLEFNPENNSFRKIFSISASSAPRYSIVPVLQNEEGTWCMQENKGIIVYKENGMATYQFTPVESIKIDSIFRAEDLFQNNKIIASNDDFIFIRLSEKKILQLNIKTHELKNLDYPNEKICGLACNASQLFIASRNNLSCININTKKTTHTFLYSNIDKGTNGYSTIELTSNNHLLVSIEKRLFEFDTACNCKKEIRNLNSEVIVTTGDAPFIYEDKFKRIWLLTLDEIKRIQNEEVPFEHLLYPGEKNNFVRSIYLNEQKNIIISGCFNGGIQLYDSSGKPLWKNSLITNGVKDILCIEKLSDNIYIVSTLHKGLFLFDINTKEFSPVDLKSPLCSQMQMQGNSYSNNFQRINDSTILIGTRSNVYKCIFNKNKIQSATPLLKSNDLYIYPLTCFFSGRDKILWVGSEPGALMRVDTTGFVKIINIPENYFVKSIAEDTANNVWLGTEKGLFIYSPAGKLLSRISKETGLLNDIIYALLPADKKNNFFASTNLGLSFISNDGKIKNFTKELGLQENEFNTQACAKSSTGKLFFGGVNGITAFYPNALFSITDTPFVYITKLIINDSLYNSFGGPWLGDTIKLSYNRNHIEFDIAATGLLNPNEYVYQYRLHNFDESWQSTHQPTSIRYTLQPGNYLLEINCSPILSSNYVFNKKIVITIYPPWWQTWWFRIIEFILLVSAIAFIILRYNRMKYAKKIRGLQLQSEIQNERERISKELHDNIGTQLSYISSNVDWMLDTDVSFSREEEIKRLSAVNNTAKEMISDLRETIWAIKKESIQSDELADKIKQFIQSQRILKPSMEINISEKLNHIIRFSPTEALNIFRICQEAIVNCMKHANASRLNLSIHSEIKNFTIIIEDNGKGFLQNIKYNDHYGLENMHIRAIELGAKLSIISEKEKGTTITLVK